MGFCVISSQFILSGGGTGGQNLPPPVPCSPASRSFILERTSLKKNQDFNGIQTRDLRDTSAMLYQLSYEATHWEQGKFIEFMYSRAVKWCEVYMK